MADKDKETGQAVAPSGGVVRPDVPMSSAIVTTNKEAEELAMILSGRDPPNRVRFHCTACGWNGTLRFDEDEMAAMPDGDPTRYPETGAKCPGEKCGLPTLMLHNKMMDGVEPAMESIRKARREDIKDATRTAVQTIKDELLGGGIMPGSVFDPAHTTAPGKTVVPRDADLPDASDIKAEDLEPRK